MRFVIYFVGRCLWILTFVVHQASSPASLGYPTMCKFTAVGYEYWGKANVTKGGIQCQAWASQTPHTHNMTTSSGYVYRDGSDVKAKNYCRNPNEDAGGPWCFTMDPAVTWDYCDIQFCVTAGPTQCKHTTEGSEYHGIINLTKGGILCQDWASNTPQSHATTPSWDPNAMNYCRNPDGGTEPWCYTMNPAVNFDYCVVRFCFVNEMDVKIAVNSLSMIEGQIPDMYPSRVIKVSNAIACARICLTQFFCKGFVVNLNTGPASSVSAGLQPSMDCTLYDNTLTRMLQQDSNLVLYKVN